MQSNESNKFSKFLKTRGYYMLLGLCILAVGVAGYVFISDAVEENRALEQSLSVPITAEEPLQELPVIAVPEEPEEQTQTAAEPETEQVAGVMEQTVMPVSGTVIQNYAMDRLTYHPTTRDWRVHSGVDLAAPLGEAVKAARGGTVTAVYEDAYYGMTVVVQHQDGYTSHYAGLAEELAVSAGDTVTAGQTLGTIGNTALIESAEEPHLHFEVYRDGEPMDPAGFLY